jgi:hypothetical protein
MPASYHGTTDRTTNLERSTTRPVNHWNTTRDEDRDRGYNWSNTQTTRTEQPTWGSWTTENLPTRDTVNWTPRSVTWGSRPTEWSPRQTETWTPRNTETWTPRQTETWTPRQTETWTPRQTETWTPRIDDWTPRTSTLRNWEGRQDWTTRTPVQRQCTDFEHQPQCGHGQWQTRQWTQRNQELTRPQYTPEWTQRTWEGPRENWTRPTTWTRDNWTPEWTTGRPNWGESGPTTRPWTGDYTDNSDRNEWQNLRTQGRWQGPRWI